MGFMMEGRPEQVRTHYNYLEKIYKKPEDFEIIGKGYTRIDAADKVTGRAKYTDDIYLPGMLYAKFKRSPYAHAKILNIDISKAQALPGVKYVLLGKEFPNAGLGTYAELDTAMASEDFADKKPLCVDKVCFIGDEVACVAALDEATADLAVDLIEVEYEPLEPVFDPHEALKPGAPLIHSNNVSTRNVVVEGDVEKAFAEADFTYSGHYTTHPIYHCALEPHACVASWEEDELKIWLSSQCFFVARHWIAENLGLPVEKVRMMKPYVGGGFGGKVDTYPNEMCAGMLSMKTGRPVKLVLSREESFFATKVRHPFDFDLKYAFNKDGKIIANRTRSVSNGGAYGGSGLATAFLSNMFATLPYEIDNVDMECIRATTNLPGGGAMRGYSSAQVHFAHELQMDAIAAKLNIDPIELRKINAIHTGYVGPMGLKIDSCAFTETMEKTAAELKYEELKDTLPEGCGVGIGSSGFCSGESHPQLDEPAYNTVNILVRLHHEGYATIYSGVNEIGQGSRTVVSAIVAEELGLSMDQIRYIDSDSTTGFWDSGAFGSRCTLFAGNAARRAAGNAKYKLFEFYEKQWNCDIEDLMMKGGRIYRKSNPEIGLSFGEAVFRCEQEQVALQIFGEGTFAHDDTENFYSQNHGNQNPAYSFSTCGAKVNVDEETGLVDIEDFIFSHDCGMPLNLRAVEGQIEGSAQLSVGYVFYEEPKYDKNGKLMNPSFRDYRFPTALDMPDKLTSYFVCEKDPHGPYGAKEAGEGSTGPIGPALTSAVNNATGLHFTDLPLTPEKIWRAIKERDAGRKKDTEKETKE